MDPKPSHSSTAAHGSSASTARVIDDAALDRARAKAYRRLLPLLFFCYVIAYVDRNNVAFAKLTMIQDLPGFSETVFGQGMGIFFLGYFLLEIPGTLIVERWSARKWICRIMVTWGIVAALTAFVELPWHFFGIRFLLGLAEAGFFPGVIVYLTHWFPARDRSRALSLFFVATPCAQIVAPLVSRILLKIGTTEMIDGVEVITPKLLGLSGWQWMYIAWGVPAVLLGVVVWFALTDRPRDAKWLTHDEREALESSLARELAERKSAGHMSLMQSLQHPKVWLMAAAYFLVVTGNYGVEGFLPSILKDWHKLNIDKVTLYVVLPSILVLAGQIFVGWNSDRTRERRWHTMIPMLIGAAALGATAFTRDSLPLTIACFMFAAAGVKAYMPAFWALPSLFLSETAAAGSIGLINSFGNLGGYLGPSMVGFLKDKTGGYQAGLFFLAGSTLMSAIIVYFMQLGKRETS